jgi:hypothetical protein
VNGRDFLRVIQDAYDQLDENENPCLPVATFHAKLTASYNEDNSPKLLGAESSDSHRDIGMPSLDATGMYMTCNDNNPMNIEQGPTGTTYTQAFGSGIAPSYIEPVYSQYMGNPEADSKSLGRKEGLGESPDPHKSCR